MMLHLHCRCGKLQGELSAHGVAAQAICYCQDCQAFARFLDADASALDPAGGSALLAASPAALRFTSGAEYLACMSLSPRGIYRWYASCCMTAIGNTPRSPKLAYVGLLQACLDLPPALTARPPMRAHTASARLPVRPTPLRAVRAVVKIGTMLLGARISGRYRTNPFFVPGSDTPVRTPQVLTAAARSALHTAPASDLDH